MIDRFFLQHPHIVGESDSQHFAAATGLSARLFVASLKCLVHALVPVWCKTDGSDAIIRLHKEVVPRRYDQPTL